jgi:predicted Zn-dependent protease
MERNRNSDAIARLDKYLSQRESAPLRVQAGLLQRENRVSEALDLLASLRKGSLFNPLIEIAFAEALIAANKPKEALATLDGLTRERYNSLAVQILRSRAQALTRDTQTLQL